MSSETCKCLPLNSPVRKHRQRSVTLVAAVQRNVRAPKVVRKHELERGAGQDVLVFDYRFGVVENEPAPQRNEVTGPGAGRYCHEFLGIGIRLLKINLYYIIYISCQLYNINIESIL